MARGQLILDRYEPLGTAGTGGFGTVRIAWDPRIQRKVAIKTIELSEIDAYRAGLPGADAVQAPSLTDSTADRWHGAQPWDEFLEEEWDVWEDGAGPEKPVGEVGPDDDSDAAADAADTPEPVTALAHLPGLDEARTAAKLTDSRIVGVYDFEVRGQIAYLIMEYVEGITLTQLLADYEDFLTLDVVAAVFDSVAGALSVAHKAGVLHLDIKPDNILINADGQVKVTDFGLATLADASGTGTAGGGTIGYMPLEQMRREPLDARTDEWSLASVTYEMLTGENPFQASTLADAEKAIEGAELILPSLCWDNIDEQVDDVIFYALDPDRDRRYASVRDFSEELDKFLGDAVAGRDQLTAVVEDALGMADADADETSDDDSADDAARWGLFSWLRDRGRAARDKGDSEEPESIGSSKGADRVQRARNAAERMSQPWVIPAAAHAFGAIASAFLAFLALSNLPLLWSAFGSATPYIIGAIAVLVGVAGAIRPHAGALTGFLLLSFSLVACGHPVVGAVLALATILWWYAIGRDGLAAANVALLGPLAGAIGGSSAVPLIAGASLRPIAAIATAAFSTVVVVVLASLGSSSLLGWNAFAHWNYVGVDITANLLAIVREPSTWATIAGWVAAAAAGSLLGIRRGRWLPIVGLAVGVTAVLVGSLVFAAPAPELFASVILAAAALIAIQMAFSD